MYQMLRRNMKISIIMAAYNRSNVLRYAVESVLRSTIYDWELIVIGDACTDDTETVVKSFHDPRISFYNLPENCGEQTGPNNEGLFRAQGEYIAFLSQDDLWFPDHLQTLLHTIEANDADGAVAAGAVIINEKQILLNGILPEGIYSPWHGASAVASLWLIKRTALLKINGWRSAKELLIQPSQDVLMRLWKNKYKIVGSLEITAILIHAGYDKNSYRERTDVFQRNISHDMINNPHFREKLCQTIAVGYEKERLAERMKFKFAVKKLCMITVMKIGKWFGKTPLEVTYKLTYRKKGRFLNKLRESEGLPPLK